MGVDIDQLVQEARLEDAVTALESEIRSKPGDARLRLYLFQVLSVMGQWPRAGQLIGTVQTIDSKLLTTVLAYRGCIEAEIVRQSVFAGKATPMLLGEPEPWMATWIQAASSAARGEWAAAAALRDDALEQSPATPFQRNGRSYPGLIDADTRLGPMLEVVLDGNYYWVPTSRVRELNVSPPESLADLVWAPTTFVWSSGGESNGYVPVRYPGSEGASEPQLRLARATAFVDHEDGASHGLGQRVFFTGEEELGVLELGHLAFTEPSS